MTRLVRQYWNLGDTRPVLHAHLCQVVGDAGGHVKQTVGHVAQALLYQSWGNLLENSVAVLQDLSSKRTLRT